MVVIQARSKRKSSGAKKKSHRKKRLLRKAEGLLSQPSAAERSRASG